MLEKITDQQLKENGVVSAPDKLEGDPKDNKAVFDRLVTQLVAGVVNQIIEAHNALDVDVNGRIDAVLDELRNHVDVDPGNITAQNVGLLRELAEKYGLTDKPAPTVHDALAVLERWAKLQPETAESFGLTDGATLDDAFKQVRSELNSGYPQIGDTLTTVRTDLDDSWLLCDGKPFRKKEYPVLADVCAVDTMAVVTEELPLSGDEIIGAEYKGGVFALLTTGAVYARRGETGAWDCVLNVAADNPGDTLLAVRHDGREWNVLARSAAGGTSWYYWAYSTADVYGGWKRSLICESVRSYTLTPGGKHLCAVKPGRGCAFVSTHIDHKRETYQTTFYALVKEDEVWSEREILVNSHLYMTSIQVYGIYWAENSWFITVTYKTGTPTLFAVVQMNDLNGNGAEVLDCPAPLKDTNALTWLRYMGGCWVTRGSVVLANGSTGYRMVTAETLLGAWEHSEYETPFGSMVRAFFVYLGESGWLLVNSPGTAGSNDKVRLHRLPNLLEQAERDDTADVGAVFDVVRSEDGTWFCFGKKDGEATVKTITDAYEHLPTLTAQNAYVYIKAKEGAK